MKVPVIIAFTAAGIAVGVLQTLLLSYLLKSVTSKKYTVVPAAFAVKLALYAVSFAAVILLFKEYLIPFGVGVGTGMAVFALIRSAVSINRNKN